MKINPDPHEDGFEIQPTDNVTAELADLESAQAVASKLEGIGYGKESITVFVGEEGLKRIDLTGEDHGIYGFLIRSIQHISHEWRIHESARLALESGRVLIGILTDGSDEQISAVVEILKDHDANAIVYWGKLSTKEF